MKTNETVNDWSDLVNFINKINNTTSSVWIDSVSVYFNLNMYLKHYAATMLFGYLDSYTGSGHNYYLYHNTSSNQFEFIEWDVNGSFGRHHPSGQGLTNEALLDPFWVPTPTGSRPLHEKILAQSTLKQEYVMNLCGYLNSYFDTTSMYARIDSMANIIRPYVYADPRKQFTNADFENNLANDYGMNTPGLKKFVRERNAYLDSALSSYGCASVSVSFIEKKPAQILIYPNPTESVINIKISEEMKGSFFFIFDLSGRKVMSGKVGNELSILNLEELSPGIYFFQMEKRAGSIFKLIKQ
ncbi:MAG: CotH kinase family protein [Bacteroidia bacterium]|nr:CotH kinase family protein [Bacteroidia bacterium]